MNQWNLGSCLCFSHSTKKAGRFWRSPRYMGADIWIVVIQLIFKLLICSPEPVGLYRSRDISVHFYSMNSHIYYAHMGYVRCNLDGFLERAHISVKCYRSQLSIERPSVDFQDLGRSDRSKDPTGGRYNRWAGSLDGP